MKDWGENAHRETQEAHSRMRAYQRFGYALTLKELYRLCKLCAGRRVPFVANQSMSRTVWRVVLPNGRPCHAVYDSDTKMIATFFPAAWGAGTTEGRSQPMPHAG